MIRYADDFEMYENEPCFGECRKVKILVQECFRNYNTLCEQEMCLEEQIRTQNVFKRVDFCHMNYDCNKIMIAAKVNKRKLLILLTNNLTLFIY